MSALPWRYALTNALMVAFIAALAHGGWPVWAAAALAILIGGLIDEAVGDEHERSGSAAPRFFDVNLYATLPLLVVITLLLLQTTLAGGSTVAAATIGAGYFYALAGVTVAHELTHRVTSPLALVSARALLAFTLNPTFETYHVYGHHRNVGSWHDPATARRGEYVLAFVARTVVDQSVAGWFLEAERLRRKGLATWSWHNRVLGGLCCSLAIFAAAAMIAGVAGMLVFLAAAVFGRIIHEMVNYVQHYGLVRADGAPIEMRHAWDSCRLISNALHYNLPRHADHHMFASKSFWELDLAADAPKLPRGYQTMSLIALYPPAWHRAIDPLLADWDGRLRTTSKGRSCGTAAGPWPPRRSPRSRRSHSRWKNRRRTTMSDEPLIVGPESAVAPALLRREPDHVRQIDWSYAGGIAVLHLLALLAFVPWLFSWTGVLLVPIGMYTFGTLGINIGLHRLLTHRSLACPRWLERTLVLMGTCGWMDSPAYWVAVHRRHHQFADEERDPHSPIESFFWSHLGWYMVKSDPERRAELVQRYAKDVLRDPLYAFLERNGNWLLPIAVSWLALFALGWAAALAAGAGTTDAVQFGASVLVWGGFVRGVVVFHITMSVNSFTHLWGYRNYQTNDNSKNNVFVGLLAAGEGWHNNHHADPRSARHGLRWWELDIAWLLIRLLERAGLARDIVMPSPHVAGAAAGRDS